MVTMKKSKKAMEDKVETAFKLIDKDGTGTISK
jgi:Ca2+-binding EF-hand superfamily protein